MKFEDINPITKFLIAILVFAVVIFVKGIIPLALASFLFLILILIYTSKKSFSLFLLSILPFLMIIWIVNAAFTFCGKEIMNFYTWKLTDAGFIAGTTITLRIFTMLLTSYIFVSSTNPRDFLQALVKYFKMDYRIAFAAFIAIRLLKESRAIINDFNQAFKARGLNPWNPRRFFALVSLIFFSTMRRLFTIAISAESRGFGSYDYRIFRRELKIGLNDYLFSIIISLIIIFSFLIGIYYNDFYFGVYSNSFCP
jgi:energy-coupling factor transporter transmembrane protein EcfT